MKILLVADPERNAVLQEALKSTHGNCVRCLMSLSFEVDLISHQDAAQFAPHTDFVLIEFDSAPAARNEELDAMLGVLSIPHAFYSRKEAPVEVKLKAPIWCSHGFRLDMLTRIVEHYRRCRPVATDKGK